MRRAAHHLCTYLKAAAWFAGSWLSQWARHAVSLDRHRWRVLVLAAVLTASLLGGLLGPGEPRDPGSSQRPVAVVAVEQPPASPEQPSPIPKPESSEEKAPPKPAKKFYPVRGYDSINPWTIPRDARVVAGYVDGAYRWNTAGWKLFSEARKIKITVFATNLLANAVDIEPGAASAQSARGWLELRQGLGRHPNIIYCMRSQQSYVQWVMRGLHYYLWVADSTWVPHRIPYADMVQWGHYRNVDTNTVYSKSLFYALPR